jgi:hypothetical protein
MTRSKSLNDLSGLKKNNEMKSQCQLEYIEYTNVCNSRRKSVVVIKIWNNSMWIKRQKAYTKAVLLVLGSSLFFVFMHLPMIWSKVYNLVNPIESDEPHVNSDPELVFVNGTAATIPPLIHSYSERETLIMIAERLAYYLYYLNFVSNVFFYSLKSPSKGTTGSFDNVSSKLRINKTANKVQAMSTRKRV